MLLQKVMQEYVIQLSHQESANFISTIRYIDDMSMYERNS